ncbi:hypothetical protein KY285_024569 [Solanum tuberosum]|nr:hypothetical protein KY285_024569 [Solanum tuberosum]
MRCDLMMGRWEWLVIVHSINFPWKRWSRFATSLRSANIPNLNQLLLPGEILSFPCSPRDFTLGATKVEHTTMPPVFISWKSPAEERAVDRGEDMSSPMNFNPLSLGSEGHPKTPTKEIECQVSSLISGIILRHSLKRRRESPLTASPNILPFPHHGGLQEIPEARSERLLYHTL